MASHGVTRSTRIRTEEQRQQDLEKIAKYRHLENQIRAQVAAGAYNLELFDLTTKLLRQNPEYYTIWNVRRRCLLACRLSGAAHQTTSDAHGEAPETSEAKNQETDGEVLQTEIAFTMPLLMEFPKCYWIWNFRQWLLSQAIQRLPLPLARKIWETELGLVSKMLNKDQRNFHAWGYRRLVVAKLESSELDGKSMAEDEFAYTTKMIRQSLSNFSAWHNRSQLIPKVLEQRGADDKARAEFLTQELNLVRDALNVGPEDQSLWYYHQFLVSQIVGDGDRPSITPNLTVDERVAYLKQEIEEIKDLLEDYDDVKWIYEALSEYTVALERLQQSNGNNGDLQVWLTKLRTLDPMRTGRWNDVQQLAA
ncbi:protein prenylyltransferase [Trichoderma citrinoviride]|uniref:Geranylgeranyl transferase type-2 subunit alpha n=1 Tax=Trichoderma citrinoviride TaxID=58853 RepID=A0A2T4B318_9HYPO|nr:protein prenylyltransferase [Trichoderma citrinoviride]PTB63700.1 protein prenylyltransferase [Trichoderma citrinoviride]